MRGLGPGRGLLLRPVERESVSWWLILGVVVVGGSGRTPRYLECQFEERSEPVSVDAGMLLLGGGVGMVGDVLVFLVLRWYVRYLVLCFDCHMRMEDCLIKVPAK